jgi:hypothetical protein
MNDPIVGYQNLAMAIIAQAVEDYSWAYITLKEYEKDGKVPVAGTEKSNYLMAKREFASCRNFFRSTEFATFTSESLIGDDFIQSLDKNLEKNPRVIQRKISS